MMLSPLDRTPPLVLPSPSHPPSPDGSTSECLLGLCWFRPWLALAWMEKSLCLAQHLRKHCEKCPWCCTTGQGKGNWPKPPLEMQIRPCLHSVLNPSILFTLGPTAKAPFLSQNGDESSQLLTTLHTSMSPRSALPAP